MRALYLPRAKSHVKFPFFYIVSKDQFQFEVSEIFRDAASSLGVQVLAPRATTILEFRPLSDVTCSSYSIITAIFHTWTPFPPSLPEEGPKRTDSDSD
jgi:hypothetical protein